MSQEPTQHQSQQPTENAKEGRLGEGRRQQRLAAGAESSQLPQQSVPPDDGELRRVEDQQGPDDERQAPERQQVQPEGLDHA